MKVLIVGGGGRESAFAWKLAQSPEVTDVIVAPGNPGMKRLSPKIKLKKIFERHEYLMLQPDLVVIGPEAPLAEGLSDFFEAYKIPVVGPSQKASRLEGSKVFCKEIFRAANIPTAAFNVVTSVDEGRKALCAWKHEGVVVKVDSLAQGKGVVVCFNREEAMTAIEGFLNGDYLGFAVEKLLLEEKLSGPEVSAFALCDGEDFVYLGSATDYKRLKDDDQGPNTGGMGTISPSPIVSPEEEKWISDNIFAPTLKVMNERGTPFKGFLFAGLMKTEEGFYALEFNTRMGDPETQSLFPRLEADIFSLFMAAAQGKLKGIQLKSPQTSAIHIVLSAEGYPGTEGMKIRSGDEITTENFGENVIFFPAGVSEKDNRLVTSGGRVCGLTVVGKDLRSVREQAYQEINKIKFEGMHFRSDIGKRFL